MGQAQPSQFIQSVKFTQGLSQITAARIASATRMALTTSDRLNLRDVFAFVFLVMARIVVALLQEGNPRRLRGFGGLLHMLISLLLESVSIDHDGAWRGFFQNAMARCRQSGKLPRGHFSHEIWRRF